ncbi:MAG: hypothetical protein SGJ18_12740 [Pseudomonadota bacterium]|nr:hypothetical protein [Pseudomonadota bacterium]
MNAVNTLVLFATLFSSSLSFATVEVGPTIKVQSEIKGWNNNFKVDVKSKKSLTQCRETQEISGTFLCQSHEQKEMNMALTRASFFVEGNNGKPGVIVPTTDSTFREFISAIGGHDLKGSDLLRYYDAAVTACDKDKTLCADPLETELFEEFIIPKARANPNFIVITFALVSAMRWQDVVTHEILHAQYFSDDTYRQVADSFWDNSMSTEEKEEVKRLLSNFYDTKNDLLMKNEFQAYILMANAKTSELGQLVQKYREPLLQKLAQAKRQPLQVK